MKIHRVPAYRTYMGDARGHWEGNTLVVDTTNFIGGKVAVGGAPYSDELHLVERFTRGTDANTIDYEITVSDPKTFTAPWKVAFPIHSRGRIIRSSITRVTEGQQGHAESFERCPG